MTETKLKNWTPLIDSLVRRHGLVAAAIFGVIWRYSQMEDGVCRASQETIAERLGLKRITINRNLAKLVESGYIRDLTPDLRNRPHVYADTGKANLETVITAIDMDEEGVSESYTKSDKNTLGVSQSYSTVSESYSGCNSEIHPGVSESYMSKTLLKESLKESDKRVSAQELWKMVTLQLQNEVGHADYNSYVKPIVPVGYVDHTIVLRSSEFYPRSWCESRLTKKIERMASAIAGAELSVEFCS